jgi:hypothetical protein
VPPALAAPPLSMQSKPACAREGRVRATRATRGSLRARSPCGAPTQDSGIPRAARHCDPRGHAKEGDDDKEAHTRRRGRRRCRARDRRDRCRRAGGGVRRARSDAPAADRQRPRALGAGRTADRPEPRHMAARRGDAHGPRARPGARRGGRQGLPERPRLPAAGHLLPEPARPVLSLPPVQVGGVRNAARQASGRLVLRQPPDRGRPGVARSSTASTSPSTSSCSPTGACTGGSTTPRTTSSSRHEEAVMSRIYAASAELSALRMPSDRPGEALGRDTLPVTADVVDAAGQR